MSIGKCALVLLAVGSLPLLAAATAGAEIYKWVDEQGRVHFQDHPPQEAGKVSGLEVRASSARQREDFTPPTPFAGRAGAAGPSADTSRQPARAPQVELYTVAWCPWCRKAREFFRSRGVPFTDHDVEKDSASAAKKKQLDSGKGVPFAIVNGVKISGYSPEEYSRALRSPAP